MTDEARALLIVAALLSGASGGAGFVGGRASAPVPPPEVRYVTIQIPAAAPEVAPIAPDPQPPAAPIAEPEAAAPEAEIKPVPKPRPKVEEKPKPKPKARPSALKKSLPSCDVVKREYQRMNYAQQMAAYARATAEEIAHGKRCLGM